MIQKSKYFAHKHAESFKDQSIAETYRFRPPYPAETFEILAGLSKGEPKRVLDVGCGIGNIARNLVAYVDQVDAVDFSQPMLTEGRNQPNGDHPQLHWLHGRIEDVALEPPYSLITAGESLHWMEWETVLPRFQQLLVAGGYLAVVEHVTQPDHWSLLSKIIPRYTTNNDYEPYDMMAVLEKHGLFKTVGTRQTQFVPFPQSIDDYIASYHSRSGFSKERMGLEQATAFDQEAREILFATYNDGIVPLQIASNIIWGLPQGA
ncbi:class I SAM-dependent methyltransferase [Dictyobacter kobayashii]|uniref:Methyltransferase domain-containing protein n=1 Tax=Dictyobacter kobayashii TaxID=2014872 RepID=A0A402AWD4_9CHLR|nr:class I SAM-dependent methyltransferase [Dictyobacter kobayashii]GCE23343.1 hypothetical protein KDK_71430 [Dictyobacter kobayashii]